MGYTIRTEKGSQVHGVYYKNSIVNHANYNAQTNLT